MSQDHSLVVIDATDAVVLPPEAVPATLDERQQEELEKCEFHLSNLGPRIAARENDLIYLYIEAGWWLMRARAMHVAKAGRPKLESNFTEAQQIGKPGFPISESVVAGQEKAGFGRWFDAQKLPYSIQSARKYMRGAQNVGLTPESNIIALRGLRDEKKLHGKTLGDVAHKPVDKTEKQAEVHEVTEEEEAAERLADLDRVYTSSAQFLAQAVIAEQTWADWTPEKIDAYAKLLAEAARVVKAGAKQKKTLPAPQPPITPVFGELEVDRDYTQEEGNRGLWWYGYRNQWGTHFAHPFLGDWADVLGCDRRRGNYLLSVRW